MNLENIKEIVKYLKGVKYSDLFGAIMVFEKLDYLHDLEDLNKQDLDYLEELYDYFMDCDYFTGLFNTSELVEMYEIAKDEESEEEE